MSLPPAPNDSSPAAARLFSHDALAALDERFLRHLSLTDPALGQRLLQARALPPTGLAESTLLIDVAAALEAFVAGEFGIPGELARLQARHHATEPLLRVKYKFVKRQGLLGVDPAARETLDADALRASLVAHQADPDDEPRFAEQVLAWQAALRQPDAQNKDAVRAALDTARDYAAWAAGTVAGRLRHRHGVLFDHPQPQDAGHRLEFVGKAPGPGASSVHRIDARALRPRRGFVLSDPGFALPGAMDQAKYCLLCHHQGNDSCSHGLPAAADARQAPGEHSRFARSIGGEALAGCPLEERISEFHELKLAGHPIGALAMIVLDNPMVAATGHRICNDCMKSCVYQQQTPVDIPQAETRVLRDVLELPWGVEIYALLTRWNPLDLRRWLPSPPSGRRVLVVGCGPAGFTLAHHLLNAGHEVVAIDGLRIEPDEDDGLPVRDLASLEQPLDQRVAAGFGGVAEYGITVRWDKNFLRLVRRLLERRPGFRLFGGVRFGSSVDPSQAWALGFDHVALATGAGRPTMLTIPGGLANGVRAASDFLMALQLTGAARIDSLANLQLRLPAVVIGAGLTAMDTATEALAYYPVQVEKYLQRHEALCANQSEAAVLQRLSEPEREVAHEYLDHARALRALRALADPAEASRRVLDQLQAWGGVTIVYRKPIESSPAWRLNPEEMAHALAEGVTLLDAHRPLAIDIDSHRRACAVVLQGPVAPAPLRLPARSVFVAAGTHPNAIVASEYPGRFTTRDGYLASVHPLGAGTGPKAAHQDFFCRIEPDGRRISFLGDAHPAFAGNVVRAMASAKRAAPAIDAALRALPDAPARPPFAQFTQALADRWQARVSSCQELAPGIIELALCAPSAARAFRPGQFYRLQNFETLADSAVYGGNRLGMEALAMTGAWVDRDRGLLGLIVLESGASSDLVRRLRPGEPVVLMGPTGSPTEIVGGETVVLLGGGLGNAVLFSIGAAFREAGSRVLYLAAYHRNRDRFRVEDIEAAADAVVWCVEQTPDFAAGRATDVVFQGNIVQALLACRDGRLTQLPIGLAEADRLIAIGSDRMMAAVADAVRGPLAGSIKRNCRFIASINSPMQCMMKEICGQCLQWQDDPVTGEARLVFSCNTQDQPMLAVDFTNLADRLAQNGTQEKQTRQWLSQGLASDPGV